MHENGTPPGWGHCTICGVRHFLGVDWQPEELHDRACEDTDIGMGLSTGCGCAARRRMAAIPTDEFIADKVFPKVAQPTVEHNHDVSLTDCWDGCPAYTPLHDHRESPTHHCWDGCPARRWAKREQIIADGHTPVCVPREGEGADHGQHDHVPGEADIDKEPFW